MVVYHNGLTMRRRWFVMLTLLAFGLTLGIGAFLWQSAQTSSIAAIQTRIDVMKPVFTTIRFLLIGLVALLWPALINVLHRWGRVDEAEEAQLLSMRWRIVTWLVVIELMLGQNLLSRFISALQGASA